MDKWRNLDAETIVADIANQTRMEAIFKEFRPQYIFHAAAYKHVPMMEDNVSESIQTNVAGTRILADLAVKYKAEKFVMISTDKAVNPTNVMGCSKRICEIYVQSLAKKLQKEGGHVTQFITTRFGNVLGSNGSVIPRFKEQIRRGGPVTVTHPEIVTNPGNTYQILDDSRTISVTVKAKRSILNKIKTDDIRATADMKNLDVRTRSLIPIDISIPSYAGRFEATANPINLRVSIELGKSETFPITATSSGTPRDGYQVGELKANPEKIKISGPESVIDSIDKVVALVDVSGQSKDEEKEAELILYDNNGKIIDSTQIENNLGDEGLKVKITMLQTKSIPVEFDTSLIGTASGYHFSGISIQPESIQIVGTEEQLETVDSIEIPAEELAEDGLDQTIEKTVDIANYLPYWAKTDQDSAGGVPIVIKIQVEKFGTKTVEFPYNSIALLNAPKDYKVSYAEQGNLEIVVRGSKEDLDDFNLEKGSVSINLNDCKTAGTYNVPIQVTLPDGIELEDTINVQITLTKSSGGENDQ